MTDRTARDRITTTYTVAPMLLATLCLAACEAFVGEGPQAPVQESSNDAGTEPAAPTVPWGDGGAKPNDPPAQADPTKPPANNPPVNNNNPPPNNPPTNNDPVATACSTAPQKAQAALTTYCSSCHGNVAMPKAGFNTILEVDALLTSGKVVANEPEMSIIFKRISAGSMPPADVKKRPGAADIAAIKEWISCGAEDFNAPNAQALAFMSIDTRLRLVLDDLRSISNPIDRERMRYIDLSSLSNAGISGDQLQVYREAVSFLLNSLSRGRTVVAPDAIDKDKLLYRLDLRDYLWDEQTWNQLEDLYPYSVIYDQDSRLYPFDEVSAEQIRQETNTQIPMIQGDWFLSHASRPPLYYSLLELPDTLQGLEQQLGVDIQRNIDTEQVLRSGFANAGPSQNNRVIERHELGGNRGALWLSYDFGSNLDDQNIFANPLDFQEDGGEMIFNLENGLQGYYVADAAGNRLDKAPNNVVQDPASRDGAVEAGLSCMNCHQTDGQLPKYDEIRDFQLSAGANAGEIEAVLAIYVPRAELQAAFDEDQNRYRTARSALSITKVTNTTMHALDDTHLGIVDLNGVASVVGLKSTDLQRSIDASPQAFPPEIVTLRTKGGGIQRDSFESIIGDLIEALGLGDQLTVDAAGNRVSESSNSNTGSAGSSGASGSAGSGGSSSNNDGRR
jgi:cytochrome c553